MLSATAWVPRGVAAPVPSVFEPSDDQMKEFVAEAERLNLNSDDEDGGSDAEDLAGAAGPVEAFPEEGPDALLDPALAGGLGGAGLGPLSRLMAFPNPADDPYLTNVQVGPDGLGVLPDDDSDADDFTLRKSDALLLGAVTEAEFSHMEVYVYEENEANLYVHHDVILPAPALSLSWMNMRPGSTGETSANVVAIGTMMPGIEIWDLDVIEGLEPIAVLGGTVAESATFGSVSGAVPETIPSVPLTKNQKKKAKKKAKARGESEMIAAGGGLMPGSHSDAVLSLSWNAQQRNVLASGSADTTVKLWDLTTGACSVTAPVHQGPVSVLEWNSSEATVILSGSYDHTAAVWDVRTPDAVARFNFDGEVEAGGWAPGTSQFAVGLDNGTVVVYDARSPAAPMATLAAHNKGITGLSWNPVAGGLLATSSMDKYVKLWDMNASGGPAVVTSRTVADFGAVFNVSWYGESPALLSVGGGKGKIAVWDVRENLAVRRRYGDSLGETPDGIVVGVEGSLRIAGGATGGNPLDDEDGFTDSSEDEDERAGGYTVDNVGEEDGDWEDVVAPATRITQAPPGFAAGLDSAPSFQFPGRGRGGAGPPGGRGGFRGRGGARGGRGGRGGPRGRGRGGRGRGRGARR